MQRKTERLTRGPVIAGHRCAFTLVELLIVTGLLASLAAFSWPSVRRSLSRAERLRAVESVRSLLADARSRALARGRPHVLRFDDRSVEMKLFEIRFDEADADQFQSNSRQVLARPPERSARARVAVSALGRNAAPGFDAKSPQARSGIAVDPSELSGPALKLVESGELPANFRCRAPQVGDSRSPGGDLIRSRNTLSGSNPTAAFAAEANAHGLDTMGSAGMGGHFVRLLFDVEGRTADAQLEICGPDGLCTPLLVAGALGKVTVGTPHKRVITSANQSLLEVAQ